MPTAITTRTRRRTAAAMVLLVVSAGASLADRATAAPRPPSVPEALGAASLALFMDTSTSSGCMASKVVPVAFRSDRIVLRWPTTMSVAAAQGQVANALNALPPAVRNGWNPVVGSPRRIVFPKTEAGVQVDSTIVFSLSPSAGEPRQIVGLARGLRGLGVKASPDYANGFEGGPVGMWPFGFPQPTPASPPARAGGGDGVTIMVYDTGVAPAGLADLPVNLVQLNAADVEQLDRNADGVVDLYYGGHQVAIASTIQSLAPGARVVAARVTEADGVATDSSTTERMTVTLKIANDNRAWPQIVVTAFGSPACDGLEPVGMGMVTEAVDLHDKALVVASAGNLNTDRPFYPAAFDGVLAVGAVDTWNGDADGDAWASRTRTGPRASFSNHGSWVDAWAPGVELVTDHVRGLSFEPGKLLAGTATVRGTSYAAPYVAAMLAEQMRLSAVTAEVAWNDVIRPTGTACPRSGGGTAVALTAMSEAPTTPPSVSGAGIC